MTEPVRKVEESIGQKRRTFDLLVDSGRFWNRLKEDIVVFTDKRILRTDKQGAKNNRLEYTTIPYRSVHYFRKEITGRSESELIIYLTGIEEPLRLKFKHDNILTDAYQVLSKFVLR